MIKKVIKPLALPILRTIYNLKKKLYFQIRMNYIIQTLSTLEIKNISKFNEKKWHHGYSYFTGYYKNKKVFIKIDTKLKMLKNEKVFYELMENTIKQYLVPLELFFENKKLQLVIYEFLEDFKELDNENLLNNLNLLDDIYIILKSMKEKKVIHRDVKLNNFMVGDSKIKIIDFTFSNSLDKNSDFKELDISKKENYLILKTLGLGLNTKDFQWNDSIAIINILNSISNEYVNEVEKFNRLSLDNSYSLYIDVKHAD